MTVATALLGSYLVASKIILREAPVFTATFVRLISAAVVLAIYLGIKSRYRAPRLPRVNKHDACVLLAQGTLGVFVFSIVAMHGVQLTGAIESGVILSTVPIAMSFVALVFLKESMSRLRILGILLSVAGAVSINVLASKTSSGVPGMNVIVGSLLLVCAVGCECIFMTFGKLLSKPIPPAILSLILSLVGAALFIIPTGFELKGVLESHISWQTWALMIYTGVAINGVAVVLMYDSLDRVDTTVVAAFTALTPVSGTILSVLFIGEQLYSYHVIGIILVCSGVFIVAREASAKSVDRRQPISLPQTTELEHRPV